MLYSQQPVSYDRMLYSQQPISYDRMLYSQQPMSYDRMMYSKNLWVQIDCCILKTYGLG